MRLQDFSLSNFLRIRPFLFRKKILTKQNIAYSYFKKGCRKRGTRQSQKVLWVILSSLFFKEISKNGKRSHGRVFASAKKSNKSRFDSYSVRKSALIISHITFRDCRLHSFSDNLSRNSCVRKTLLE